MQQAPFDQFHATALFLAFSFDPAFTPIFIGFIRRFLSNKFTKQLFTAILLKAAFPLPTRFRKTFL